MSGTEAHAGASRWLAPGRRGLYLADSAETAWAELYRALAESRRGPIGAMPRDLHRVSVNLDRVADLSAERSRRSLGLPRMRPTEDQWSTFRAVGTRLENVGAQGVLYPSAARTRSLCLCIFEAGLSGLTVAGEPVRLTVPPPPPRGLRT
ncbi:MAG: RES family NAD+ phosphorylase [Candidatus Dormibacteraceae bacterium]